VEGWNCPGHVPQVRLISDRLLHQFAISSLIRV
jgi:hypothetical protein